MNNVHQDILNYVSRFLQRTDQISLKLTNKYFFSSLIDLMDLNTELKLFIKPIDQLDYAWKNDPRYINIKTIAHFENKLNFLSKYALLTNLWYFDFNAEFAIYPDEYIIMFLTTVSNYTINLEFVDTNGSITNTSHKPIQNKIIVKFNNIGKLKINCKETTQIKSNKIVQYIMCIPVYYWNKLTISSNNKFPIWKKQITGTNFSNNIFLKNF